MEIARPSQRKRIDKWASRILKVHRHVLETTGMAPKVVVLREIVPRGMCFASPLRPGFQLRADSDGTPYELAIHPETWDALKGAYPNLGNPPMIWGVPVQEELA